MAEPTPVQRPPAQGQGSPSTSTPRQPFVRPEVREVGTLEELTRQFGGTL